MRLRALILTIICLFHTAPAFAQDDRTEEFLLLLDEVNENRRLFDKAVNSCIEELSQLKPSNDSSLLDKCVSSKGIELNKFSAGAVGAPVYQMGRRNVDDSVLVYQIPDKGAVMRRLQGGAGMANTQDVPAQSATMPAVTVPARPQNPVPETNVQKRPSSRPKIYLPSDESEGSPKPIFLKRQ